MLNIGGDKQKIRKKIREDVGINLTRKDLDNITRNFRNPEDDEIYAAEHLLKTTYGAETQILRENDEFQGLYFSTPSMKQHMAASPEIVSFDGTY
ncbi:hypothetical protein HCN44_003375 [Aphidius gifuensis]|uniref:Uncharacterized protein n=1 Tax=Aphidius gifuensis TaxID=684658 RepID=A0A834XY86_APHGI|nr:hypothetical protein HCN44_003375 [Aphidius gifuensis]